MFRALGPLPSSEGLLTGPTYWAYLLGLLTGPTYWAYLLITSYLEVQMVFRFFKVPFIMFMIVGVAWNLAACRSVDENSTSSETKSVYDNESYVFRAVKKGEDKIGFEVCTIDKKYRRFIAQNQFRTTDCVPAYRNDRLEEVTFSAQDLLMTFSKEELAVAKMVVLKLERYRVQYRRESSIAGYMLGYSGVSAALTAGSTIFLIRFPAVFLGVMAGVLGTTVVGAAINENMKKLKAESYVEKHMSSKQTAEVVDKIAARLHADQLYDEHGHWHNDELAEMAYHWGSIMDLDATKGVEVSSVLEIQQVLGYHLSRTLSSNKISKFCHPYLPILTKDHKFGPLPCLSLYPRPTIRYQHPGEKEKYFPRSHDDQSQDSHQ